MQETWNDMSRFGVEQLPALLVPVAILIVGWLLALLLGWLVRAALARTTIDERIAERLIGAERTERLDVGRWTGKAVYWVVLLLTVLAVLQSLSLSAAADPLSGLLGSIFLFIPRILGAAIILLVAWVIAVLVRKGLQVLLRRWDIDRRIGNGLQGDTPRTGEVDTTARGEVVSEPREGAEMRPSGVARTSAAGEGTEGREGAIGEERPVGRPGARGAEPGGPRSIANTISETVYWLVILLFVPAILDTLGLQGLLAPVQDMFSTILTFLPNLISAGLIFAVGWFVARIVARLVANVLAGLGLDRVSERVGVSRALGARPLSRLLGVVVQVLILIPVAIAALQALQLESVTAPASRMLGTFLAALPMIFAAVLLLGVAWIVARLLRGFVRALLSGVGFDRVLPRLGISEAVAGRRSPSDLTGLLVAVAVMFFAAVEAARLLGFDAVAVMALDVAELAGRVLLGLVIFGLGMYLANLAAEAVRRSNLRQARVFSVAARGAVLVLAGAMALRQMGIANEIIELAFGLALGAIAVAAAIAFGFGGRDAASTAIEDWRKRLREQASSREGRAAE